MLCYVICEEFVGIKFRIIHCIVSACPFVNRKSNVVSIGLDCRVHCATRQHLFAWIACSKCEFGDIWIIRLFWKTIKHFLGRHCSGSRWKAEWGIKRERVSRKNGWRVSHSDYHLWPLPTLCLVSLSITCTVHTAITFTLPVWQSECRQTCM